MKRRIAFLLLTLCLTASGVARAADPKAATKPSGEAADKPTPTVVDSIGLLEHAVAKDSTRFDNLYRLGVMYLDHDRVTEATRVLLKASQIRPKDVKTLVNLGASYDAAGSSPQAQEYYRKALALAPDDSVAMCRLASSLYAQSKYADAVDMLRDIIRKRPTAYCAYFTLGVAFADVGLYRDAIRMWKKVVDMAPSSPEAVSARESIEVLEKFIQSN